MGQETDIAGVVVVVEAYRLVARSEADHAAFVQVGADAADHDDPMPHAQVMAEL